MRAITGIIIASAALLGLAPSAGAQPVVSDVVGAVGQGFQFTVVGSSFGSKAEASPVAWDDFQGGNPGDYLIDKDQEAGGAFDLQYYECRWPVYSTGMQRFAGDVSALQEFDGSRGPPDWPEGCGTNRGMAILDQPSTVWYVSYWCYQDDYAGTALFSENVKITPFFFGSGWNQGQHVHWQEFWNGQGGYIAAEDCHKSLVFQQSGVYRDSRGKWTRVEAYLDVGDTGVANGWMAVSKDLEILREHWGLFRPVGCEVEGLIGSVQIGNNFFNTNGAVVDQYLSELYIDHSFARVEIGDAPIWNACTHREIQIPADWSNNSITVTGNVGTFVLGTEVYLFVVDENNQPSAGVPVIIGEDNQQGDLGAPGVPGTVMFSLGTD